MSLLVNEFYPRVLRSHARQTLFVRLSEEVDPALLTFKLQPMEKYAIPHTPRYRIDEEDRYPYASMKALGDGLYSVECDMIDEQQYFVRIRYDGQRLLNTYVYAVDDDLAALRVFKGDTHLHTCRSDGEGTPFEVACAYREAGYDFIAITDHHKFAPSLEGQEAIKALTDEFHVFRGEEVHNKGMGYFHIVNFNGESSINEIIETDDAYVEAELTRILATHDLSALSDPRCAAYRIFVTEQIRRVKGVAIMAHPFWDVFGEYHMQTEEFIYHWQNKNFDALEVVAACDNTGNGTNLQELLRCEMMGEGYRIPVVGASDAHNAFGESPNQLFNKAFTLVFAKDFEEIPQAVCDERSVAVDRRDDKEFRTVGKYRYAKYARFLLREYAPAYVVLCKEHAAAIADGNRERIGEAEKRIAAFRGRFFGADQNSI